MWQALKGTRNNGHHYLNTHRVTGTRKYSVVTTSLKLQNIFQGYGHKGFLKASKPGRVRPDVFRYVRAYNHCGVLLVSSTFPEALTIAKSLELVSLVQP